MLYYTLATLVSVYSVLAVLLLVVRFHMKRTYGVAGFAEKINSLAGTKTIAAFEMYSYLVLVAWLALALPLADLFAFQWFSHFENRGLRTCFGWMTSHEASNYIATVLLNILGAKAALVLVEISGLLRKGRVRMVPRGIFQVWMPEPR